MSNGFAGTNLPESARKGKISAVGWVVEGRAPTFRHDGVRRANVPPRPMHRGVCRRNPCPTEKTGTPTVWLIRQNHDGRLSILRNRQRTETRTVWLIRQNHDSRLSILRYLGRRRCRNPSAEGTGTKECRPLQTLWVSLTRRRFGIRLNDSLRVLRKQANADQTQQRYGDCRQNSVAVLVDRRRNDVLHESGFLPQ